SARRRPRRSASPSPSAPGSADTPGESARTGSTPVPAGSSRRRTTPAAAGSSRSGLSPGQNTAFWISVPYFPIIDAGPLPQRGAPPLLVFRRTRTMKITKLTPMVLGTPWRNLTYLKVETDEGLVGVSETRSIRTDSVLAYLKQIETRYVLGSDPFNIEALVQRAFVDDFLRVNDISGAGIALVEMACWDIIGKALGQPVYKLLGGATRDKIKAYANGWYTVERSPEAFQEAAKKVVAR